MGEQLVGDEDRLGVLHVGASGHDGVGGLGGLVDEGVDDVENEAGDVARLVTQVHADEGGDLVVAAASGAQAPTQVVAGALDETAFQGRVNVLVGDLGDEDAGDDVRLETVQGIQHAGQLAWVQQAGLRQGAGVGSGAGDVVSGQAPVEVGAHRQCGKRVSRPTGEPPTPQADTGGARVLLRVCGNGLGGGRLSGLAGELAHGPIMAHLPAQVPQ